MTDYTLYYWPLPFRGEFVRAVLAHAGASWTEADIDEVVALKDAGPVEQPVPHMGPPVLIDHAADCALSQMPAILEYLGRKHGLIPGEPERGALTTKIIADANDVLYEMTLHNGAQMWTPDRWAAYEARLERWMSIFEDLGRRHGLTSTAGHMLGTAAPGVADLVVYSLWGVMAAKLAALRPRLERVAPGIAGLCDRIGRLPAQRRLRERSDAEYGEVWCGGQIEASLRTVLGGPGSSVV